MSTFSNMSNIKITTPPPPLVARRKYIAIGILFVVLLAAIFLYLSDSTLTVTNSQTQSGLPSKTLTLPPNDVAEILLRSGVGANDTSLDILYTPTWYFTWNKRNLPELETPALGFFLMETVHSGELINDPPPAYLQIDGQRIEPISAHIVSDAPHHRVSQVLFSLLDESGKPYISNDSESIVLITPINGVVSSGNTFEWTLPLPYGLGALNTLDAVAQEPVRSALTWTAFLAIMGGMLSALSPCLLQLGVYYAAVLTGTEAAFSEPESRRSHARLTLMKISFYFVFGFTLVYTTGGVIAGYVGQSLEQLSGLQQWYRPVSFVAGVIIIILAVRVALQAKAPLVCRLPIRVSSQNGGFSSALMGISFAVGCLSCFSATVLSALLIYAGSTGSPITGGLLLFLFSSGVGGIFLLAAWALDSAAPGMTNWLERSRPIIGGISALIMITFGILMITYEFHTVSGFFFRLFSA